MQMFENKIVFSFLNLSFCYHKYFYPVLCCHLIITITEYNEILVLYNT